jgi:putative transposase
MTGHRISYRLQGHDYSRGGCYYVTICTRNRACLFGEVRDGEMHLNRSGQVAQDEWSRSADLRSELVLDAFVVMPNHIHGIVFIDMQKGDPPVAPTMVNGPRPRSLGSFIGGYKSSVTRRITLCWLMDG